MKNGLPFLRIIGGICLLFLIDSESFGQCSQCLSNVLILNTGVNQETSNNAFYGTGSQDDFWTLIQGPSSEGPYPKCAYSRGASSNHINGALNPCCDVSASPSGICDGNMTGNANDCHWGGAIPYVFERRFCVNTGNGNPVETAILNISKVYVDLDLAGVTISGPTGNFTVDNTCHEQSAGVFGFSAFYFPVKTGVYYLRFTVGNDWGNGCNIIPCWNVPTYMALEVDAFITSGAFTPIFTDNKHFGKFCNVNYVSFEAPKFSSACAPTGATDLQIQITNYVNTNGITYDISPAPNSINLPYFIGNVGTEYTVTVQDSKGCSLAKKIKIVGSPTLTVTPKVSCYTDSLIKSTDSIKVSTADGAPDYIYTIINGNLPPNLSTSIIVGGENESINLPTAPGFYTITVTDMNGCSATSTAVYNLVFPPPINPVPDVCLGSSITLTAQTPASVPPNLPGMPYQYNWLVPVNSNTNPSTYTPLVVGPQTYTCQVTSAYGCTSTNSATHIVYPNPVITVTNNNAPCNPVFTATFDFTTPLAYWGWVGTPGTNFGWSSVPSVSVTAPSGSVPNLLNTTFTVYCIDQHGCESSYIGNYNEKPFCCNSQQLLAAGTHAFSSNAAYANGNASSIISAYTSTTITTNNYILFDGDIVIDQSLNFVNCPNIRFDPNCLIHVTNGATLRFTNCYLEASCNYMWKGIIANTPNEKVVLQNSTVRSMDAGVVLTNGAGIDVSDCIFQNNFNSIELNSTPSLYNLQTGNCSIIRSLFESDGLSNLLPPHSNQLRGENGIRIVRPRNAEIGRLVNDEFNVFRNLYCGINIIQHNDNTAEYVKLNNNKFDNIQDEHCK